MVETIRWMVVREDEPRRREVLLRLLALFLVGGLVGGAFGGLMLAGVAMAVEAVPGVFLGFVAASVAASIAYGGSRLGWWAVPAPQFRHQVPQAWRDVFPPSVASFIYAGALGIAYFTRVSSMAFYGFVLLLIGLESPGAIVLLFALSGLVRASTALLVPILGSNSTRLDVSPSLDRTLSRFTHTEGVVLLSAGIVLAAYVLARASS